MDLNDLILKPADDNLNYDRPWIRFYPSGVLPNIDYPEGSMYDRIEFIGSLVKDYVAVEFLGLKINYSELIESIDDCARGLIELGVKKGDKVTICIPNTPHAVVAFYAVNKIGAISNMVHPLSAPKELEYYLNLTESRFLITINFSYSNYEKIKDNVNVKKVIVCKLGNYLKYIKRAGYWTFAGRKIPKIQDHENIIKWKELLKLGNATKNNKLKEGNNEKNPKTKTNNSNEFPKINANDPAVILYTGGTTGKQKGVVLSNLNFNALALQIISQNNVISGDKMMCIMPFFHGFGLGVSMHTTLVAGGTAILVPKFSVEDFATSFRKHSPEFVAGVPTMFAALIKHKKMMDSDFSKLKGVYSGADTLPNEIKLQVEEFMHNRGAKVNIREGYGLTETVTASCLTPQSEYRFGSIGIPFPDTLYKICKIGTQDTANIDEDGEICIYGPSVMLEYYKEEKETADVLKKHKDGKIWVHTGDLGSMDKDGFIYFKQRIKRIIKHSGYSIFPSQIEDVLMNHPAVNNVCVVGVPDDYQMEKIRAYVVLEEEYEEAIEHKNEISLKNDLLECSKKYLSTWSMPQEIIFRKTLPLTKVGKIDYVSLEKEILEELKQL
ncbi:MAG: AMP-binding protein [Methanobrevibacter sp.]|jgi:long-chain acyl-CoA synthetase|nr:AMP-binding protein [Candidatus Methanoflexus mossambicus]